LWHIDPLLGNDSVSTFPPGPTRSKVEHLLLGKGSVNTPKTIRDNRIRRFPWVPPRGYITGSSKGAVTCQKLREFNWVRCCPELGRVLEMAVEGDWEEMARNKLDCDQKISCTIGSCS
jgi:hypothetical protein